jgi:hypothetical protein
MQSYTIFERLKNTTQGWYTRKLQGTFYSLERCALAIFQDCNLTFPDKFTTEYRCAELATFFKFEFCGTINGRIYIVEEQSKSTNDAYKDFEATIKQYPKEALEEALIQMTDKEGMPRKEFDVRYPRLIKKYLDAQPKMFIVDVKRPVQ